MSKSNVKEDKSNCDTQCDYVSLGALPYAPCDDVFRPLRGKDTTKTSTAADLSVDEHKAD